MAFNNVIPMWVLTIEADLLYTGEESPVDFLDRLHKNESVPPSVKQRWEENLNDPEWVSAHIPQKAVCDES